MPLHLGPLTRRDLLKRAALSAGVLTIPSSVWSAPGSDRDRIALFSDTHISEDPAAVNGGINMTENLRKALGEVLGSDPRPSGLLINGDCAFLQGLSGDYAQLATTLKPAFENKIPVHFLLGNHDHRERVRAGLLANGPTELLESKHASMLRTRRANLFLLDSLDRTNVTPGLLGREQLDWLRKSLDKNADKPAILFVHHQPGFPEFGSVGGLTDTAPLFEVIAPRKHVKAIFFGHTHHWLVKEREGIHCVNLPPVAYVFNQADPSGWVDLRLQEYGATIRLNALDRTHKAHGEEHRLVWR